MPPRRFCISLAGYVLCVDSTSIAMEATGAVAKFVCNPSSTPDLLIDLRIGHPEAPSSPASFESGGLWSLHQKSATEQCIALASEAFVASPYAVLTLSKDLERGQLVIDESAVRGDSIYPLDYPLDEVLLGMLLARHDGIEFHCAGIVDERGDGHLFIAQSETGKTTMANLWLEYAPGCRVLSDDRIVVRMDEGGKPAMYGTPWHGDAMLSDAGAAPLSSLVLLRQSKRNEVRELGRAEAVARLLTCTFPPFYDASLLDRTTAEMVRLTGSVERVIEFGFVPERSAVEFIREQFQPG